MWCSDLIGKLQPEGRACVCNRGRAGGTGSPRDPFLPLLGMTDRQGEGWDPSGSEVQLAWERGSHAQAQVWKTPASSWALCCSCTPASVPFGGCSPSRAWGMVADTTQEERPCSGAMPSTRCRCTGARTQEEEPGVTLPIPAPGVWLCACLVGCRRPCAKPGVCTEGCQPLPSLG